MNINATFRPIDRWPGEPTQDRQPSRFKAGWSDTLDLLQREIAYLGADHAVIQLALSESEIRLDGWPRANARPAHPGVILAIDSKYGPLKYPCDTFTRWHDNLRAIALALEALRKVDRYGVTKRGEQYTGWKALPGGGETSTTLTAEAAAGVLVRMGGGDVDEILRNRVIRNSVYRRAARAAHPDTGGSVEDFQLLQQAMRVLDEHFGGRP